MVNLNVLQLQSKLHACKLPPRQYSQLLKKINAHHLGWEPRVSLQPSASFPVHRDVCVPLTVWYPNRGVWRMFATGLRRIRISRQWISSSNKCLPYLSGSTSFLKPTGCTPRRIHNSASSGKERVWDSFRQRAAKRHADYFDRCAYWLIMTSTGSRMHNILIENQCTVYKPCCYVSALCSALDGGQLPVDRALQYYNKLNVTFVMHACVGIC